MRPTLFNVFPHIDFAPGKKKDVTAANCCHSRVTSSSRRDARDERVRVERHKTDETRPESVKRVAYCVR